MSTQPVEFEELQELWTLDDTQHTIGGLRSPTELSAISREEAAGAISQFAQAFRSEVLLSVGACVLVFVVAVPVMGGPAGWLVSSFVGFVTFVFYCTMARLLFRRTVEPNSIVQSMRQSLYRFESFERWYVAAVSVACVLGYWCLWAILRWQKGVAFEVTSNDMIRFVVLLCLMPVIRVSTRHGLRRFYGKHIQRLRDSLADIE